LSVSDSAINSPQTSTLTGTGKYVCGCNWFPMYRRPFHLIRSIKGERRR
jgi:hypothetical protein